MAIARANPTLFLMPPESSDGIRSSTPLSPTISNLRLAASRINRGETMVVIGGSGSGKSVLIKHVIGLLTPDEGSVVVDGVDISHLREKDLNEFRKKYGMLFQAAALFDSLE